MVALLRGDRPDVAAGRRRQKLRGNPEGSPFGLESGNEESLRELAHCDDVLHFRAVGALVPLRIMIPHRVRLAVEDRRYSLEIEPLTFAEEYEVGLEPARLRQRPPLRELAADHASGTLVVDEERL